MKQINKLKTFAIHTLGCKVNIYDSNIIANQLKAIGLIEVDFKTKADLYIINTCSVTNQADSKSRLFINKAKRTNPEAIILVCGCYSQVHQEISNADIILGNKYKNDIVPIIEDYLINNTKLVKVNNLLTDNEFEEFDILDFAHNTRAFLKIQEGCNFMCSYCIIPFARGRQRSKNPKLVLKQIKQLVEHGYKEIVLTGVNTAGYLYGDVNFESLLFMINELKGDFRIRISSMEPFQISSKMINLICNNPRFCQHWHICLQSGSDEVLKAMNRKYTTNDFLELINSIYQLNPYSCITTDYICGFPTETDQDHLNSLAFCQKVKFYQMHIFPYSKRNHTPAALLKQIPDHIKKTRVNDFIVLSHQLETQFIKQFLNKEVYVLVEEFLGENKYLGKTSEYIEVILESPIDIRNQLIKAKINKIILNKVFGSIIYT